MLYERILLLLQLMIELVFVIFDELVHVISYSRMKRVFLLLQTIFVRKNVVSLRLFPQVVKLDEQNKETQWYFEMAIIILLTSQVTEKRILMWPLVKPYLN